MADQWAQFADADPEATMRRDYPNAADVVYGPDMRPVDLEALMQRWQASMPPQTIAEGSGRVPQFAGPEAMAPPLDRESANYSVPGNLDTLGAAFHLLGKKRLDVLTTQIPAYLRAQFGPTITNQDISNQLPKEQIPYLGPRR